MSDPMILVRRRRDVRGRRRGLGVGWLLRWSRHCRRRVDSVGMLMEKWVSLLLVFRRCEAYRTVGGKRRLLLYALW